VAAGSRSAPDAHAQPVAVRVGEVGRVRQQLTSQRREFQPQEWHCHCLWAPREGRHNSVSSQGRSQRQTAQLTTTKEDAPGERCFPQPPHTEYRLCWLTSQCDGRPAIGDSWLSGCWLFFLPLGTLSFDGDRCGTVAVQLSELRGRRRWCGVIEGKRVGCVIAQAW